MPIMRASSREQRTTCHSSLVLFELRSKANEPLNLAAMRRDANCRVRSLLRSLTDESAL